MIVATVSKRIWPEQATSLPFRLQIDTMVGSAIFSGEQTPEKKIILNLEKYFMLLNYFDRLPMALATAHRDTHLSFLLFDSKISHKI